MARIRAFAHTAWTFIRPALKWIALTIAIIAIVIVIMMLLVGPVLSGVVWTRDAFVAKGQEWETILAAPWPTPKPPVRNIAPAPFVGGSSSTTGIATVCEFDYSGTRVMATNSKDLQWFTLNNANRILFVCNGRVQHVFVEIPPEHFNDWMSYLPPELQNMTVPDMAVPAVPQETPEPQPLNRNQQQFNGNPPPAVTAVPNYDNNTTATGCNSEAQVLGVFGNSSAPAWSTIYGSKGPTNISVWIPGGVTPDGVEYMLVTNQDITLLGSGQAWQWQGCDMQIAQQNAAGYVSSRAQVGKTVQIITLEDFKNKYPNNVR